MSEAVNKRPGTFKKGRGKNIDPRINKNGRPKYYDELRRLAQDILDEIVEYKDKNKRAKKITRLENILFGWSNSDDFAKQSRLLEIAWSKGSDIAHLAKEIDDFISLNMDLLTVNQLTRISKGKTTSAEILRELLKDVAQVKDKNCFTCNTGVLQVTDRR